MEKLKDVCKHLDKLSVKYERSENGQAIQILACKVGDNFYDYDEAEKPITFYSRLNFLKNDPRIQIIKCEDCCGCAGW